MILSRQTSAAKRLRRALASGDDDGVAAVQQAIGPTTWDIVIRSVAFRMPAAALEQKPEWPAHHGAARIEAALDMVADHFHAADHPPPRRPENVVAKPPDDQPPQPKIPFRIGAGLSC